MRKIISTKKTSAIFLTIVLIAGTFAALSPSFMIGAHAQQYGMDKKYNSYEPDYGMNSYDDKQSFGKDNSYPSKDSSSAIVKKVKCNNINVNVNGDTDIGASQDLGALATDEAQAADEGEVGASTLGNGGGSDGGGRPSGSDSDSRFVCIDNNDNTVVGGEEPISELCEECFASNSRLQTANLRHSC